MFLLASLLIKIINLIILFILITLLIIIFENKNEIIQQSQWGRVPSPTTFSSVLRYIGYTTQY